MIPRASGQQTGDTRSSATAGVGPEDMFAGLALLGSRARALGSSRGRGRSELTAGGTRSRLAA